MSGMFECNALYTHMIRVLMQVVTIDHVPLVAGLFCHDTYVDSIASV